VTNCTFTGNHYGAIFNFFANPTISNCIFVDNVDGLYSRAGDGDGVAIISYAGSPKVANCTFFGNSGGAAIFNGNIFDDSAGSIMTVSNCILWGNAGGIVTQPGNITNVTNTDLQDLAYSTLDGNGNFAADPRFVRNPGTNEAGDYGDLHLLLSSPCVDTGCDSAAAGIATDLGGSPRISRAHVDLGAYEYQNHAPSLTVPANAQLSVGNTITLQSSATDSDCDAMTYSLVNPPSWASINSSTGVVTLSPRAGVNGNFTVQVKSTDVYGASDTKAISVSVCPIIIDSITVSKKNGITTVQFNVRNTDGTILTNVSINSSTLKGIGTVTPLPIVYPQLKQGVVKTVQLKFLGVPSGSAQFIVNGSSSAGPFSTNVTVNVP
jgi:hypothetical protein